ncbi:hypothetical protein AVEN_62360-1 [Araneus ventricosus]|uniref:Uncharacterized protein n=1 Tax=Araneus ventricosus TaxID=182803 RepID=A0A4Y2H328_ARAVE|nr:hypothetical protein AVEN_62360-1 [Araneus ventricosus]
MAYLAKSRKEDLLLLAEELGLTVNRFQVKQLHKLFTECPSYYEEFSRELLGSIKEEREKKKKKVKKQIWKENVKKKNESGNEKEKNVKEKETELLNYKNFNWKPELQGHSPLNLCRYLIDLLKSECTM